MRPPALCFRAVIVSLCISNPLFSASDGTNEFKAKTIAGDIDTTDAVVVGTYRLSAYRVDKNYQRYIASEGHQGTGRPAPEITRAWFTRFLAEQVLTAQALKEGYGERPEVTREVSHMEHHMLTQFAGPFYEHLYSVNPGPASLPALDGHSATWKSRLDVEILRVPRDAPIASKTDHIFAANAPEDNELNLATITASGQSEYFSGLTEWPFMPFEEIAGAISNAPTNHWQKFETDDALLLFRVRSVHPISIPPAGEVGPPPPELLQHLNQRRVQKERQRRIIRECGLTFDWPAAQRWVDNLTAQHPDPLLPLDPASVTEMLSTTIACFRSGKTKETITVAAYINYFNDLYIRFLPRNALDVFHIVQSMIVDQCDYTDAQKLGVDRAPKFVEDRRNYHDSLALDLYIRERIRPSLGISDADIARFYDANIPAFTRPTRIEGAILTFTEIGDAQAFAQAPDPQSGKALAGRAQTRNTLVLTPTTVLPGISYLPGLVFSAPPATVLGPFQNGSAFAVWVFERVIDSETRPLKAVSQEIRSKLEQPQLEQRKAELARTLSVNFPIEDRIAYEKYGIDGPVTKPWNP